MAFFGARNPGDSPRDPVKKRKRSLVYHGFLKLSHNFHYNRKKIEGFRLLWPLGIRVPPGLLKNANVIVCTIVLSCHLNFSKIGSKL